jgi:hypothetical protein
MVEKADAGACQGDAMFLAGGEDVGGADRPAGLGNVTHAVLLGVVDVVAERDRAVGDETACRKVDSVSRVRDPLSVRRCLMRSRHVCAGSVPTC